MNQEELLHKIDLFLWQLLPESEQKAFEEAIRQDPNLKVEVEKRDLENKVIKQLQRNDVDRKMKGWLKDMKAETQNNTENVNTEQVNYAQTEETVMIPFQNIPRPSLYNKSWFIGIAACFTILIISSYLWFRNSYKEDILLPKLYAQANKLDIKNAILKNDQGGYGSDGLNQNNDSTVPLNTIDERFESKNYPRIITTYETLLNKLDLVPANMLLIQTIEWRLVLTYAAADKKKYDAEIKGYLETMTSDTQHIYHKQAIELKEKMNSKWWHWFN